MSKKTNTLLFILGGTVFNIIVTALCFVLFMVIYARFHTSFPEGSIAWVLPVIFVTSIITSFLVYRCVVRFIMSKIEMEKYFDPIFGRRNPTIRKP